ncbi:hypothetical protein DSQ19_04375 [Candidatus Nitrosotenuis sp. DW1]|nr:hypothetical protein DSQ19_04375 [Candidatus Nitrosotenuis sp. DW1]
MSTIIISFNTNLADKFIDELASFLKGKNYSVEEELIDGIIRRLNVVHEKQEISILEPNDNWAVLRVNSDLTESIIDLAYKKFEKEIFSVGKVPHISKEQSLKSKNFVVKSRSGLHESSDNLTPYSYFRLFENNTLIAEALLEYFNGEMGEFEPTILLIEVDSKYREKGIGKKFLQFIECEMVRCGFAKIWSSDTQTMDFWEKMGYDIDIDEGEKYLDSSECDDDDY